MLGNHLHAGLPWVDDCEGRLCLMSGGFCGYSTVAAVNVKNLNTKENDGV